MSTKGPAGWTLISAIQRALCLDWYPIYQLPDFIFAWAASQSLCDILVKPCPLQLFFPLQLFLADLQSE